MRKARVTALGHLPYIYIYIANSKGVMGINYFAPVT